MPSPNRICGAIFDEVVYADGTICVSTSIEAMSMFLKDIGEDTNTGNMLQRGFQWA